MRECSNVQLYDYLSVLGPKDGSSAMFVVPLNRCGHRILMCASVRRCIHMYIYRSRYEMHGVCMLFLLILLPLCVYVFVCLFFLFDFSVVAL